MKTKTLAYIIYLILCAVISVLVAGNMGYGIATWQWWVGCGCTWISFQCGRFYQKAD